MAEQGKAKPNLVRSRHLHSRWQAFAIIGTLLYGDHHLFSPKAFSPQILGLVCKLVYSSQLFGTIHTIRYKIAIHCKVYNYLVALLYTFTKIRKKTVYYIEFWQGIIYHREKVNR